MWRWKQKSRIKYIVVICLVFMQCQIFMNRAEGHCQVTGQVCTISMGDMIGDFFKGEIPYSLTAGSTPFNIPGMWSLYFICFFAVISQSVTQMFRSNGCQLAMRYGTRKRWFFYQNVILWRETGGYLLVTYAAFFLYSILKGVRISGTDDGFQMEFNGLDLTVFHRTELFGIVTVVLFGVMLAFAYLQYMISMKTNTLVGVVVSVVILVSSVFCLNPFLPGNYLMLMRYENGMPDGVNIIEGFLLCAGMIGVSIAVGGRIIKEKDLF